MISPIETSSGHLPFSLWRCLYKRKRSEINHLQFIIKQSQYSNVPIKSVELIFMQLFKRMLYTTFGSGEQNRGERLIYRKTEKNTRATKIFIFHPYFLLPIWRAAVFKSNTMKMIRHIPQTFNRRVFVTFYFHYSIALSHPEFVWKKF